MSMAMPSVVSACAAPRTQPGQRAVALAVVDRVAELVEHRVHPALARLDVAEHAHVALAVDVDAERVLALAVARVEVAVLEHRRARRGRGRRRCACVSASRSASTKKWSSAIAPSAGGLLEERVVEVPWPQVVDGARRSGRRARRRAPASTPRTARRWRGRRRRGWRTGGPRRARRWRARGRSGRGTPSVARGLVAEPGELADAVGDLGPDLLRRLPRRAAFVGVVARAEDLGDGVVVDAPAVDARRGSC